jgi:triphosphoribosyl-dephospho-CoA synthase CitG
MEKRMIEYCEDFSKRLEKGLEIKDISYKIGEAAITGMLYEVSASPTPGLVSPFSNGTHSDMNYFTFLRSTSAIAYSMYLCAQIGLEYEEDILKKIRVVGLDAEKKMFKATAGINTQRGLLFAGGIVSAAAGSCARKENPMSRDNISKECRNIAADIVERELKNLTDRSQLTNGERIYLEHGITGIRGEVQNGLPSVIDMGLPLYEEGIKKELGENNALVQSLIGLMRVVEDTVVINRTGIIGFEYMRKEASNALELGGMYTPEGKSYIKSMEQDFIAKGISPGGAADLLAITVMIYELENSFA